MERAIRETDRRRAKQILYNKKHGITPQTIEKKIHDVIQHQKPLTEKEPVFKEQDYKDIPKKAIPGFIDKLMGEMKEASANLEFERAAILRDMIFELEQKSGKTTGLRGKKNVPR